MKQLKIVCIFILLISSCKKGFNNGQTNTSTASLDTLNWCNEKIVTWGDSFTEGPGAIPFGIQLLNQIYKDTVTVSLLNNREYIDRTKIVGYNAGVSGESSIQIKDRFMADTAHRKWATIIWAGRNNIDDTAQVSKDIDTMVAAIGHQKYFIIEILNGDYLNEYAPYPDYLRITAFNKSLSLKYGNHFVYIKPNLQEAANKTYADSVSIVHDIVPASLRLDQLHLTTAGYQIVANSIFERLHKCN